MTLAILSALFLLSAADAKAQKPRTVEMSVTDKGFEPEKIEVKKGEPVHLVVTRKPEATCATEIAIKDLGIKKRLPVNKGVAIDFTPQKSGEVRYVCGMDMIGGSLIVQ